MVQDGAKSSGELMATGIIENSVQSMAQDVINEYPNQNSGVIFTQGGETGNADFIDQDGERHSDEVVIHGVEASNGELMVQDGAKSSGELMATGIIENSVQSMAQDVINEYPNQNSGEILTQGGETGNA